MTRNERRVWNAERFGYDVEGPCWQCGQAVAYFVDEDGTPRDMRATERRLTVERMKEALPRALHAELQDPEWLRWLRNGNEAPAFNPSTGWCRCITHAASILDDLATADVDEDYSDPDPDSATEEWARGEAANDWGGS